MRVPLCLLALAVLLTGCNRPAEKPVLRVETVVPRGAKAGDVIAGRENNSATPLTSPPEITSESDPAMHDLVFQAKGAPWPKQPGWWVFNANGLYRGKAVGFTFTFGPEGKEWKKSDDPSFPVSSGFGVFHSTGAGSDRFLQAMATVYKARSIPQHMAADTIVGVISLQGNPAKPDDGVLKLKVFFGDEEPSPTYGELFVNIDVKNNRLSLLEKDPEAYEAGIVKNLGGAGSTHGSINKKEQ
jgi:hypothetical protein